MRPALSAFVRKALSLVLLAGVFAAGSALAQVGTIQFVVGDVKIRNAAGAERAAVRGGAVNEGDTIVSGANGEAQLRMSDDAFVAVRRDTELRVDQYNYKGRNDGTESGVLRLVKGTFRAITGLIVKSNRQNFSMKTAVSTIGIRGTGNITNHNFDTNVTINHTVDGSHGVTSVDPGTGRPIGVTIETKPGITVQVQPGQPAQVIPTPPSILAEASKDPKAKGEEKKEEKKEEARSESLAKAETETRETQPEAPKQEPPAPTVTTTTEVTAPPPPSTSEQQLLQANLRTQLEGAFLQAQNAAAGLATLAAAAQTAATNAATSAATAGALTGADLTALDTKIATAQSLVPFAPSIQPSLDAAIAQRTTAFNAGGVVGGVLNPTSTLVGAQTAANTAATSAATSAASVPGLVTTANADFATVQATYNAAIAALDAFNFTLAQQLLDTLVAQVATSLASTGAAGAATSAALSAEATAASQLSTAQSANTTANTSATTAIASVDTAINTALGNVQAIAQATATTRDQIAAISTALGTASGTTAQQAFDAASSANTIAQTDATSIAGLAPINTAAASTNLASVTTLAGTAQTQVTNATAVNTANSNVANGVGGTDFRDSSAGPALTAMNAANTAVQGALTAATTANTTATTQSTTLTTAQSSAATQSGTATTAFNTAQTTFNALTAAPQVDAGLTNANQTVTNLLALANTAATNAQTFANLGTQQGALDAQAELAKAQSYLALAQQIQTEIAQRDAVTTAQGALVTLLTDATAAKTAGDAAVTASGTALTAATTEATSVAQQSIIAQYNNPIIVSTNRFTSAGVAPKQLGANSNERFKHGAIQKANTNFVLDGQKSLVESRSTNQVATDLGGSAGSVALADTQMTIVGGTPADMFQASSNTAGAENYIALGRVTGGTIQAPNGATVVDLGAGAGARSFHWIVGYEPPAGYTAATKLTGTTTYTKIGNTNPTDANGNVGTLNSATLAANFTAQTVTAGVNVTVNNKTLDATGSNIALGVAGTGTPQFGGIFTTVNCTGTGCSGTYAGDVAGSLTGEVADGGGFVYSLFPTVVAGNPYSDLIQGAVAFSGPAPALIPQPAANFATAYLYGGSNFSVTTLQASGTSYTLDGSGNLIAVADDPLQEPDPQSQSISGGTALSRGQVTSAGGTVVDFGRWQAPTVSGVDFNGAFAGRAVDGIYHWMKGPAVVPFYLTGALTGTVSYTAQGGFVSDQTGAAGSLDLVNSTFSANFTQQSVAADIRATTGAGTWQGVGSGIRLDGGGIFHAFSGGASPHNNLSVLFNGSATGAFGSIDGTWFGNGADAVGIGFAFGQGTNRAVGTIAYTGAAQSQAASTVIGIVAPGLLGVPLTGAGAPATGTTTLASLDGELAIAMDATVNASSRVVRDVNNNVIRFDADVPIAQPTGCSSTGTPCTGTSGTPAVLSLRDASFPLDTPPSPGAATAPTVLTNTGADPNTGITWGRYVGFVSYTDRITGTATNPAIASGAFDARTSSWHAIWSPTMTSPPVLPASGSITYTPFGGTNPTDSAGAAGTWAAGTATLNANFTSQTVNTTFNATVGANTWAASASNIPIVNGTYFDAAKGGGANSLTVTVNGSATGTSGKMIGVFTGNHTTGTTGGAMVGHTLNGAGVTVQNVTAFRKP